MDIIDIGYDSSNRAYAVYKDTWYHWQTPEPVIRILAAAISARKEYRLEISLGDQETGLAWGDVNSGYIGRSTGSVKIPLLVHNRRCFGGGALLDNRIIRIREARGKRILYQHPNYHTVETRRDRWIAFKNKWHQKILQWIERYYETKQQSSQPPAEDQDHPIHSGVG